MLGFLEQICDKVPQHKDTYQEGYNDYIIRMKCVWVGVNNYDLTKGAKH